MSFRAVIVVVAFMLVAGLSAYVALNNHVTLGQRVAFPGGWMPEVYKVVALAFLLGFALTESLALVRSGQNLYGRWKEAREARARERIERRYARGLEALLGGNLARAEERFKDVLGRDPTHTETLMTYGEMLRSLARGREASELHRKAAELRPGDMRPLFALAADWKAEGNLERAREALERIVVANPKESLRARIELRSLLITARAWDEAERVHESIEAARKETGGPAGEAPGPGTRGDGKEAAAARETDRRIGLGIRYERAQAMAARGELRDAEKEYRAILKAEPSFTPASLALGETLVLRGEVEDGLKAWRKGFEDTRSPRFLQRLEEHHLKNEEPEAILRLLRQLAEGQDLRAVVPALHLLRLYLRLEMIDEAEAVLRMLPAEVRDLADVTCLAATILERRGRLKEAAAAYRRVVRESDLIRSRYRCSACSAVSAEAVARCPACGDWNTVEVDDGALRAAIATSQAPPAQWVAGI